MERGSAHRPGGLWGWLPRSRRDQEQRLVAAAAAGSAEAFDALRARHQEAITDFCRMMLEERGEEADAVAAEVFAVARGELRSLARGVAMRPWLYALAYECCVARLGEDETYPGAAARPAQGDEDDQRRGAALLAGTLPDTELATIMGLAATRPALFGLAGEVARNAPSAIGNFAGELATEQAATEAVTALAQSTITDDADEATRSAARAPGAGLGSEAAAVRGADRIRRVATTAALTGSVAVVAGAGVYAAGESQRSPDRGGIVSPAGEGDGTAAGGPRPTVGAGGTTTMGAGGAGDSAAASRGRTGRGRTTVIRLPGRSGAGGREGLRGREGAPGGPGAAVRDPSRFLPPGTPGGGAGPGPGGGGPSPSPRPDPLVSVDARVGPVHARVDIPPRE